MKEVKFYQLENKSIVALVSGEEANMANAKLLVPGAVDAAQEKHVPALKKEGSSLVATVGSVIHPMEEKHHIVFIALATEDGLEIKYLKPGDQPTASFKAPEHGIVYEFCNLHGLWKTEF